jgi:hypothetical protein
MRRILLFVTVLLAIPAGSVLADEGPQFGRARPHLAGHSFVETPAVPSPFIRTYIRNRVGIGQARDLEFPVVEIDGEEIVGFEGKLLFALLDFEFQYAIRDWLAIRGNIVLVGRLGTDVQALLSEGVSMTSGFEFGWLARLRETERTALSLDLGLSNRNFTGVNITQFVEDIIDDIPPTLVNKSPSLRGYGGVRWSWAASPLVGVTARGLFGYAESLDRRSDDKLFGSLGVAVDFDIAGRTSLPFGAAVAYTYDTLPEFATEATKGLQRIGIRLSYVGRQDFLLSLDLSAEEYPQPFGGEDVRVGTTSINMRYYF